MKTFKAFLKLLNLQMLVVVAVALSATFVCKRYGIAGDFPLTLIGTAIVFPLVFSINSAYKRREKVLDQYANLKAHGRALYYASTDWLEKNDKKSTDKLKKNLEALLNGCNSLFHSKTCDMLDRECNVYSLFDEISHSIQDFRKQGLSNGEVSRCNQFLSKMIIAFEEMKHVYQYRTPQSLRSYNRIFIYLLPIIYGPHFAYISQEFSAGLWPVLPILFSIILVGLDNVQDQLENPFDQIGEDDVKINPNKFADRLV